MLDLGSLRLWHFPRRQKYHLEFALQLVWKGSEKMLSYNTGLLADVLRSL